MEILQPSGPELLVSTPWSPLSLSRSRGVTPERLRIEFIYMECSLVWQTKKNVQKEYYSAGGVEEIKGTTGWEVTL